MYSSRQLTTRATAAVCLAACLMIGASCSSSSSTTSSSDTTRASARKTTTTSALPAGYTAFEDHADQFRIAVPGAWRQIDPASPGASQSFAAAIQANPGLQTVLGADAQHLVSQGVKFLAADVTTGDSVNVVTRPAPGGRDSDLADAVDFIKQQYAGAGISVTGTTPISRAGHKGLRVGLVAHVPDASGGQVTKNEVQDFLAANDLVYIITYAGDSREFVSIGSSFDVSA